MKLTQKSPELCLSRTVHSAMLAITKQFHFWSIKVFLLFDYSVFRHAPMTCILSMRFVQCEGTAVWSKANERYSQDLETLMCTSFSLILEGGLVMAYSIIANK